MSNIFTLVFTLCLTGLLTAQADRLVLLEEFTNASCPPCASQNPAYNALVDQNRNKVVSIKWQTAFPGFDPMNQHNADDVDVHYRKYATVYPDFGGVPTTFLDGELPPRNYGNGAGAWGGYLGGPYGYTQAVIDFAAAQPAPVAIDVDHNLIAGNDSVEVSMQVVNVSANTISGDLKVHIILMEKDIIFPCGPPGSTNEFDFYDVARRKLTGLRGMSVNDMAPGDTIQIDMIYAIPGYIYNKEEVYIAGYLQDWNTLEVFNAAKDYPKPLSSFKDVSLANRATSNDALCDESYTPAALVQNTGLDTVQSISLEYDFNGTTISKDFSDMNLAPGSVYVAEFDQITHPGGGEPITFEILNIDGASSDGNRFNDVGCEPFVAKKASAPAFTELEEEFDDDPVGEGPNNFNVNGEYLRAFVVADQDYIGSPGSAGYRSQNAVLVDFHGWPTDQGEQRAEMVHLFRQDFSNVENSMMTFRYFKAFRRTNPTYSDSLLLQASYDCGLTWETIWSVSGASWATGDASDDFTTPRFSSSWEEAEVSLEALEGQSDITLKFVAVNGGGNTLMLDNIVIEGEESVSNQNPLADQIKLWPNPASLQPMQISLPQDLQVNALRIYDLSGKMVDQQQFSTTQIGRMSWTPVQAGAFIMELDTNEGRISKRVMVIE